MKTLNKAELRRKVEARRAELNRQKRLEEARSRVSQRKAVRPIVERTARPAVRPVVKETVLTNTRPKRAETIKENIMRRNREYKIPASQHKLYTSLAENIASYGKAVQSLNENFNAASQARGNYGARGVDLVGSIPTFFDIFYGFFPQLVAPHIASVQPLKTEHGYIFYMQFVAGSDKGTVEKGQVLADPFEVSSQYEYTSDKVTVGKLTLNTEKSVALWAPVKAVYLNGVEVNESGIAVVEGKDIAVTITETDTHLKLKITDLDSYTKDVVAEYVYDNVFVPTEVPLLAPNIVRIPIAASYRTIKTNHAFQAAYGYEAEHGAKLGEKLADAAMEQLKREVDLHVLFKAWKAAPSKVFWNKAAGVAVGGYQEHKLSIKDAFAQAANLIFAKSKRVRGNTLVVGIDTLTIVETLPGFAGIELGEQLPGAAVVGKLGKLPVIASPDVPADEWLMLYKGSKDNFDAGIVFAPYLPVFATEPAILDDFVVRQAFITAYAVEVVNPNYFVAGKVINSPTALPIYLVNKGGSIDDDTGALDFGNLGSEAILDIFGELED